MHSDNVTFRNTSNVVVYVAGLSVAPNRVATVSLDKWRVWLRLSESNSLTASTHLTLDIDDHQVPEPTSDGREQLIIDAIGLMDESDHHSWTQSDKPTVQAIESILGWDITADERDTAWETINAENADTLGEDSPSDGDDNA